MSLSPLKKHSFVEIENAIAKALTDLCGQPVQADISSLDLAQTGNFAGCADMTIRICPDPIDTSDVPF